MSTDVMRGNVKGVFAHLDCLMTGIDRLQRAGFKDLGVATPLPRHEIEEALYGGRPPSPVRWWTLVGGVSGATLGFTIASLTGVDWPMTVVGGRPIVAVLPYVILTFECMVLLGGLVTLAGMFYHCRIPFSDTDEELCDARFSDDHFGIVVRSPGDASQAAEILRGAGALEVSGAPEGGAPAAAPTPAVQAPPEPEDAPTEKELTPMGAATTLPGLDASNTFPDLEE
jgi:hypothetical protein